MSITISRVGYQQCDGNLVMSHNDFDEHLYGRLSVDAPLWQ